MGNRIFVGAIFNWGCFNQEGAPEEEDVHASSVKEGIECLWLEDMIASDQFIAELMAYTPTTLQEKVDVLFALRHLCTGVPFRLHGQEFSAHYIDEELDYFLSKGLPKTYFPDLDLASESLREQLHTVLSFATTNGERFAAIDQHFEAIRKVGLNLVAYLLDHEHEVRLGYRDNVVAPF